MRSLRCSTVLIASLLAGMTAGAVPGFCADPSTTVTVSGTVSGSPATVTVNGVSATISGTTFTATNIPVSFGPNTVTAVATDTAGNSSSSAITVHVGVRMTVQGTVSEAVASVSVNSVAATISGTTFSAAVPLQLGANTITVVATDPAGNSRTQNCQTYVARSPVQHP